MFRRIPRNSCLNDLSSFVLRGNQVFGACADFIVLLLVLVLGYSIFDYENEDDDEDEFGCGLASVCSYVVRRAVLEHA